MVVMKRPLAIPSMLIAAVFWPSFLFSTLLFASLLGLLRLYNQLTGASLNRTREHALVCYWPVVCWLFNFWWLHIEITGKENLPPKDQAWVIVANHESMFDIFILYFLHVQFRWLSKKEVFKAPVMGQSMKWCGYVPVERGNPASHTAAMEASADWIRRGVPMVFFPEGTRSDTNELRPFKLGAFRLAEETGVPILPIAIKGTRDILPKGAMLPKAARVHLKVLPKEERRPDESLEVFAERIRALIDAERRS